MGKSSFRFPGQSKPFRAHFFTDASESTASSATDAAQNELSHSPAGIIGFSLRYEQIDC